MPIPVPSWVLGGDLAGLGQCHESIKAKQDHGGQGEEGRGAGQTHVSAAGDGDDVGHTALDQGLHQECGQRQSIPNLIRRCCALTQCLSNTPSHFIVIQSDFLKSVSIGLRNQYILCLIQMTSYLMVTLEFRQRWHTEYESKDSMKHLATRYSERCKGYEQGKTVLGSKWCFRNLFFCMSNLIS